MVFINKENADDMLSSSNSPNVGQFSFAKDFLNFEMF